MTRHLFQLVWNRKRQNLLLAFEIFLSFLVLFAVVLVSATYYYNWRQPLGFDIERVWTIRIGYPLSGPGNRERDTAETLAARAQAAQQLQRIYAALRDLSNVEQVAASWPSVPYGRGGWSTGLGDDPKVGTWANFASDDFDEAVGLRLVAGRWFSREDDGGAYVPTVINERLARALFGDEQPIGRDVPSEAADQAMRRRVVGVITDFRQEGELSEPVNYMFLRLREDAPPSESLPNNLTIKVTADTTAALEPVIVKTLEAVAPDWSFQLQPASVLREAGLRQMMTPVIVFVIVAGFLLLMVALGLTGVVWQSVTSRIQEFGLRRAKGATAPNIQHQVLSELALLSTLALILGLALVLQVPLLPLRGTDFPAPPAMVWLASIALSVAIIYLLTLGCAWYPSRLATKIQPAEALHYE
jgi:putative ABC transport system permease protein